MKHEFKPEPKREMPKHQEPKMKPNRMEPEMKHKSHEEPEMVPKHPEHNSHEEPEMPLDMNGSTAVLDDEAPMEAAHPKKAHAKKTSVVESKKSKMSADDTDTDRAPKKGVSLSHSSKGVELEQHREADKKM